MSETNQSKGKKSKKEEKLAEDRAKLASGTTAPIPTEITQPKDEKEAAEIKAAEASIAKVLTDREKKRLELEAKKAELKKLEDEIKAERKAEADAKKAELDAAKAERDAKQKQLDEIDGKIKEIEEEFAKTPMGVRLAELKEERAKIGPLPKVVPTRTRTESTGERTPQASVIELVANILNFMQGGTTYTSREIVDGLGVQPGPGPGQRVVDRLKKLSEGDNPLVEKVPNEDKSGYCWKKL